MRHENTIVYPKCIELMETAREAIEQFPSGFGFLADNETRYPEASRNFAEGYYCYTKRQQRRYFGYAIG